MALNVLNVEGFERLTVLAMLLENLGIDTPFRKAAIAELESKEQ